MSRLVRVEPRWAQPLMQELRLDAVQPERATDGVAVEAELVRNRPDLPVLGEVEPPNLRDELGGDHARLRLRPRLCRSPSGEGGVADEEALSSAEKAGWDFERAAGIRHPLACDDHRRDHERAHRAGLHSGGATPMSHFRTASPRPVTSLPSSMKPPPVPRLLVPPGGLALARSAGSRRASRRAVALAAITPAAEEELPAARHPGADAEAQGVHLPPQPRGEAEDQDERFLHARSRSDLVARPWSGWLGVPYSGPSSYLGC